MSSSRCHRAVTASSARKIAMQLTPRKLVVFSNWKGETFPELVVQRTCFHVSRGDEHRRCPAESHPCKAHGTSMDWTKSLPVLWQASLTWSITPCRCKKRRQVADFSIRQFKYCRALEW